MKKTLKTGLLLCSLCMPMLASAAWDGVADWARQTSLSTATSGVVDKVLVQAGERVSKGDTLLQLEQGALRATLDQARAELQHQRLLREEAKRELDRSQELYARTLLADHDLDLAKIEFARAEAAYQQSRAAYHRAQEKLNNSELHAPFDAVVVARRVQPAETVVSELRAEPMLVIAAADKMLARFSVPAGELSALSPGQKVTVEIAGNRYQAVVTAISLDATNKQGAISAEAEFATEQRYLPGVPLKVSKP